jgi:hypothetical protein
MHDTMHFPYSVAKQASLELETWPEQLLSDLPLDIARYG